MRSFGDGFLGALLHQHSSELPIGDRAVVCDFVTSLASVWSFPVENVYLSGRDREVSSDCRSPLFREVWRNAGTVNPRRPNRLSQPETSILSSRKSPDQSIRSTSISLDRQSLPNALIRSLLLPDHDGPIRFSVPPIIKNLHVVGNRFAPSKQSRMRVFEQSGQALGRSSQFFDQLVHNAPGRLRVCISGSTGIHATNHAH